MQKYHSIQIQTSGALRRHWRPVALATALAAAVALGHAQTPAGTVQGTVSGVFGQQILLDTPEGQKLVNLPSGVSTPVIGARVTVDGPRNGNVIQARTLAPQETSSPTAATPPPAFATAGASLPATLQGLNLTQLHQRVDHDDGDVTWSARTREGTWLRIETEWSGRIEDIKAGEGQSLSPALLARVLPAPVAQSGRRGELAHVTEVDFDDDGEIELKGRDGQGVRTKIEFRPDGQVTELKRERWETRRWETPAVQARLQQAGYRDIGWLHLGGKHAEAEATNRFDERVSVRLNDRGQIDRERRMLLVPQ